MEEKEATSTEDVEEILVEIGDKPLEPAEEVQQHDEKEPEVIPQEIPPEISRPATLMPLEGMNFMEILRAAMEEALKETNKKLDETSQSTREELSKQIESLKEGQKSTDQKIEEGRRAVSYTHLDVYKRQVR